jgi:hypothetical protein
MNNLLILFLFLNITNIESLKINNKNKIIDIPVIKNKFVDESIIKDISTSNSRYKYLGKDSRYSEQEIIDDNIKINHHNMNLLTKLLNKNIDINTKIELINSEPNFNNGIKPINMNAGDLFNDWLFDIKS